MTMMQPQQQQQPINVQLQPPQQQGPSPYKLPFNQVQGISKSSWGPELGLGLIPGLIGREIRKPSPSAPTSRTAPRSDRGKLERKSGGPINPYLRDRYAKLAYDRARAAERQAQERDLESKLQSNRNFITTGSSSLPANYKMGPIAGAWDALLGQLAYLEQKRMDDELTRAGSTPTLPNII